jgi:hypothetical protein
MNKATKKILLRYILAPLLLALLLGLIYRQVHAQGSLAQEWIDFKLHWKTGNKGLLTMVLVLAPLNWMLEARKWQLLLRKIEQLPFCKAFSSTLTGIAFALVTPNKIGDFAGRILYLKDKSRLRGAIATLVGNLAQTIITFLFGISGLIYLNLYHAGSWELPTLIAALVGGGLLIYFYLRIDLLSRQVERFPKLRSIVIAFRVLKRYSRKDLLRILRISLIRFCVYNLQFLILVNVFGADVPWVSGFIISGLMFWLITVIPSVFIADLGVRGFIAGLIFTDTGIAANAVAILAGSYIVWFLNLVVPALIGSLLVLTTKAFR